MTVSMRRHAGRLCSAAVAAVVTLVLGPGAVLAQAPRTLAFQGILTDAAGKPRPNGTYSVTFRLFDAPSGGTALWTEAARPVAVTGGRGQFSTTLGAPTGFGALPFDRPYFLETQVAGEAAMTPRMPLQGAPYALNAWSTSGNGGSNPATQFLGTTDNRPLSLRVNGRRALLLEDRVDGGNTYHAVNVLAGASVNSIASGVLGATIAGGGQDANAGADAPNDVRANFGSIGGGTSNTVTGAFGAVAGGTVNTVSGLSGVVGGGSNNTAAGGYSVVSGGYLNVNGGSFAAIGGGFQNAASGYVTTVAGGSQNGATAQYASVVGGSRNIANGDTSTIGGGDQNTINGTLTTIAGGRQNYGWSVSDFSAIGGGFSNSVYGDFAAIPGGYRNTADGLSSFAAGYRAYAAHDGSFVWSDAHEADFVSTAPNQFCIRATGGIVVESFANVAIYTGVGSGEANRYVLLLNSPIAPSASGLKAGGILCADSFAYANPAKNNMVVKGTLGVGYPDPAPYTFAVNGTVYSAGGYSSSDIRYKRNVHTLEGALGTVLALRGVNFEWDRDAWKDQNFPDGPQIGFIAQEVEPVLPAVVSTDAKGFKAVSYQSIVPVLTEAVKSLKAENDQLRAEKDAEIARLQAENAAMQRQQDDMERRLRSVEERLGNSKPR